MNWGALWPIIEDFVAGGWVDTTTLLVAVGYGIYRCKKVGKYRIFSKETGNEVIHGLPLFPLLLLFLSVPSTAALTALLQSHKVILGAAAFVALCSILDES